MAGVEGVLDDFKKAIGCLRWLPAYGWQRATRRRPRGDVHLIVAVADHFEPSFLPGSGFASMAEQEQRLERWCREYPQALERWRDADGRTFRHTYFYPAEQYETGLLERLVRHCRSGWGEVEIHLHHGLTGPDTTENTRRTLTAFRDALAGHGSLARWNGEGPPRYAFVHGNWALANSARNKCCGVDDEMQVLADTGCYADFTLPSAPHPAQISKINAIYECRPPLNRRAPHRRGANLRLGRPPVTLPLIVQGPLGIRFAVRRSGGSRVLRIENSELSAKNPPTPERFWEWGRVPISVEGRPNWLFVKLHCHGMDPRDQTAMYGPPMQQFLEGLDSMARAGHFHVHYATAREMVNIMLAACDGRDSNPGDYRDYRLRLITPHTSG